MGIESVQPKGINSPQMVGQVEPAATPSAVAQLADAFRQGFITTNDMMAHTGGNALARGLVERKKIATEEQLLKEQMDPVAIDARNEAMRSVGAKAKQERETQLTKQFVDEWLVDNLPLYNADGTPDNKGMAVGGQARVQSKRALAYAQAGMVGKPVTRVDKYGNEYTDYYNAYGEKVTEEPGKPNPTLEHYRKIFRKESAFLIKNNDEPGNDVPEGKKPSDYRVPSVLAESKAPQDEAAAPMVTALPPVVPAVVPVEPSPAVIQRATAGVTPVAGVAGGVIPGLPSVGATWSGGTPQVFASQPAPKVIVEPTAAGPAVTVQPTAAPEAPGPLSYDPNMGILTKVAPFDKQAFMKDFRGAAQYQNWTDKIRSIDSARSTARAYDALPKGSVTTHLDVDLANAALQLSAQGTSAGGRSMQEFQVKRLEDAIPLLERIPDLAGHILGTDKFPKEVRDRIIASNERKAQELESRAADVVRAAQRGLLERRIDPGDTFFDSEKQLLQQAPAAGAGASTGGYLTPEFSLPSGRKLRPRQQ